MLIPILGSAYGYEVVFMRAPDRIKKEVVPGLAPILKAAGFKRNGVRFFRRLGSTTQVVSLQMSSGNSSAEAQFFVNVGVAVDVLDSDRPPDRLKHYECELDRRLEGIVTAPATWTVRSSTDTARLCVRLGSCLGALLELLDTVDSPEALVATGLLHEGSDRRASARIRYAMRDDAGALKDLKYLEQFFSDRQGMSVSELIDRFEFRRLAKEKKTKKTKKKVVTKKKQAKTKKKTRR